MTEYTHISMATPKRTSSAISQIIIASIDLILQLPESLKNALVTFKQKKREQTCPP